MPNAKVKPRSCHDPRQPIEQLPGGMTVGFNDLLGLRCFYEAEW